MSATTAGQVLRLSRYSRPRKEIMTRDCEVCGEAFELTATVRSHEKRQRRRQRFCSVTCSGKALAMGLR